MKLVGMFLLLLSFSCKAMESEKLSFIEINSPDASPNKVFIGDAGDEIFLNLYYGLGESGPKEKTVQCGIASGALHCSDSERDFFNKKNNHTNNKCIGISEVTDYVVESGTKIITVKSYDGGDQAIRVLDSATCKENKIPDLKKYNVKFLGVSNDVMVFHYGYGGNWAGIMQYDLSAKKPPVEIENASGDERTTSFSLSGFLVTGAVDGFHCFYTLSGKNFKQSNCLKSEGTEYEPDATSISANGKYMAVSYYNKKNEKNYLAIYKLLK